MTDQLTTEHEARRPPISPAVAILAAVLLAAACASVPLATPDVVTFHPSLAVELGAMERTRSGLYYRDTHEGTGNPVRNGQVVSVYYVTRLPDGTQVDATVPPAEPLPFTVGSGDVIAAWDEGVRGMRPGGQRMLVVPAALAYGRRRVANVPPNSVLVFLIELVNVR